MRCLDSPWWGIIFLFVCIQKYMDTLQPLCFIVDMVIRLVMASSQFLICSWFRVIFLFCICCFESDEAAKCFSTIKHILILDKFSCYIFTFSLKNEIISTQPKRSGDICAQEHNLRGPLGVWVVEYFIFLKWLLQKIWSHTPKRAGTMLRQEYICSKQRNCFELLYLW